MINDDVAAIGIDFGFFNAEVLVPGFWQRW